MYNKMSSTSTPSMTPTFSSTSTSYDFYTPASKPSLPVVHSSSDISSSGYVIGIFTFTFVTLLCIVYNIIAIHREKKEKEERRNRIIQQQQQLTLIRPTVIINPLYSANV